MKNELIDVGEIVKVSCRTGEYISKVVEFVNNKVLVETLAVQKHPTQGDLHHRYSVDVPLFHQRRALAYREKVVLPMGVVHAYHGEVPDYRESLLRAVETEIEAIQNMPGEWAERSLHELNQLKSEYESQK